MSLEYRRGSLFEAPSDAILAHACNALGSWGAGIAAEFRDKFPNEYLEYKAACRANGFNLVGRCVMAGRVACLITSFAYGTRAASAEKILQATAASLEELLYLAEDKDIHMPKINSGLFRVPWELTESVLNEAISGFPNRLGKIIIWEP